MSKETKQRLRSIATLLVVLAVLFAFAISGVRLFGIQPYGVLTGSMTPTYPVGSLVYVKAVDPATLKVSDVITFNMGRNAVATHRIIEKVPDPNNPYSFGFRTKGDANNSADNSLVRQSDIVGKVIFSLPLLGRIAAYIQHPPGTYIAILISLMLIVFVFVTDSVGEKPADAQQQTTPAKRSSLLAKYLPFLFTNKAADEGCLSQGYTPGQQVQQQTYQRYPQQVHSSYQQYPQQAQQPSYQRYPQQAQHPSYQQYPQQAQQPSYQQYPQQAQPSYQQYPQQAQPSYQRNPQQTQQQFYQQYPQQAQQYPQQSAYPSQPSANNPQQPRTRRSQGRSSF